MFSKHEELFIIWGFSFKPNKIIALLTKNMKNHLTRSCFSNSIVCCANVDATFVTIHVLNRHYWRMKLLFTWLRQQGSELDKLILFLYVNNLPFGRMLFFLVHVTLGLKWKWNRMCQWNFSRKITKATFLWKLQQPTSSESFRKTFNYVFQKGFKVNLQKAFVEIAICNDENFYQALQLKNSFEEASQRAFIIFVEALKLKNWKFFSTAFKTLKTSKKVLN